MIADTDVEEVGVKFSILERIADDSDIEGEVIGMLDDAAASELCSGP